MTTGKEMAIAVTYMEKLEDISFSYTAQCFTLNMKRAENEKFLSQCTLTLFFTGDNDSRHCCWYLCACLLHL